MSQPTAAKPKRSRRRTTNARSTVTERSAATEETQPASEGPLATTREVVTDRAGRAQVDATASHTSPAEDVTTKSAPDKELVQLDADTSAATANLAGEPQLVESGQGGERRAPEELTDVSEGHARPEDAPAQHAEMAEGPPPLELVAEADPRHEAVDDLLPVLEAVVFAAPKPVSLQQLRKLTGAPLAQLRDAIAALQRKYEGGIELCEVAAGYHFRTHPDQAHWVRQLVAGKPPRLTRAMLETLAIVAYRQPITRPEMDEIRGVDCGGTLRVLLERNLVRILGKKEEVGRPLLYGTTKHFLEFFQLKELKGLPTLREFAELSEEHRQQVDERFASDAAERPSSESLATAEQQEPLEGPPERATLEAAAARRADEQRDEPDQLREPQDPQPNRGREDEELMAVLDKALERAESVLKRPEEGAERGSEGPTHAANADPRAGPADERGTMSAEKTAARASEAAAPFRQQPKDAS